MLTSVGLEFQIPYDEYVRRLDECWRFPDFGQTRVVERLDHVILCEVEFETRLSFLMKRLILEEGEYLRCGTLFVVLRGKLMTRKMIRVEIADVVEVETLIEGEVEIGWDKRLGQGHIL